MTETGVCKVYAKRMAGVWLTVLAAFGLPGASEAPDQVRIGGGFSGIALTALLAVTLQLIASTASAESAWSLFIARCLAPMEAGNKLNLDGLAPAPTPEEWEGFKFFQRPDSEGHVVIQEDGAICVVTEVRDHSDEEFETWAHAQINSGRYVPDMKGFSHEPITLRSTEWRTPGIKVIYNWYVEPFLSVREVDDES